MNELVPNETTGVDDSPSTIDTEAAVSDEATVGQEQPAVSADPAPTTSLELYLLRHADAGDPMTWAGDDADRPLSKKGRRQAKRLGQLLKELDVQADAVLTSPKLRASETARIVGRSIGTKPSKDERLTVDFGNAALTSLVSGLASNVRTVLLVGHDPDFSATLSWLVGTSITMRKGALARIDLAGREVRAGRGSLRWLLPPDAVRG